MDKYAPCVLFDGRPGRVVPTRAPFATQRRVTVRNFGMARRSAGSGPPRLGAIRHPLRGPGAS
eukprot:1703672-Pyramimonas_sp.AAC.1